MTAASAHTAARCGEREAGMVLLVALIVLSLMGLSAIALMRAVDTATAITGNLAFRATVTAPADTVDIMPTLAALIGLPLARGSVDGHCLEGTPAFCPSP